ncbi:MAG: GNAT family N-acetyltransferase [Nitrososphaeria archaeon]|nr:GNAT family N-acetyltransferase [Nitrosopumilaceae archaeon]NIP10072.1 GNAT family N-acetyltransferase [Nitrosopumilaceae archaeon]NIP91049.1 GNAT family N-acetyltransferase [Nitrososphaeria archaeon]NIS94868.1 GNAT family N-acetyltransferase [Nitrosopumilaceae archaeon]
MIREAISSDKFEVLKFCQNTFSWGDYIKEVWDHWISEGDLFVVEKNQPIGICHAVFYPTQAWIEGIRINPDFRRQSLASKLVKNVESISKQKGIPISLMLIDTENEPSLLMAKQLGYKISETWKFYSLQSQKNNDFEISLGNPFQKNKPTHYVKSWRWVPLNEKEISLLISQNNIVYSDTTNNKSVAILGESEHFDNTLIVTLFAGSESDTKNILLFLQNFGAEKQYKRIQILSKESFSNFNNLEHRLTFHLVQKLLS